MRHPRAAKCEIMEIGDLMKSILPQKCKFLAVSADGVIGKACFEFCLKQFGDY